MSHQKRAVESENVELKSYSIGELNSEDNKETPVMSQLPEVKSQPKNSVHGIYN